MTPGVATRQTSTALVVVSRWAGLTPAHDLLSGPTRGEERGPPQFVYQPSELRGLPLTPEDLAPWHARNRFPLPQGQGPFRGATILGRSSVTFR